MLTAQTGQLFGMLTFGVVSDRVGRRPAFALYSVITASAIAPLAFAWESLSARPALFWATMLVLGIGSGCTAGFGALLAELFPTEVRGIAMGTTYNLARGAQLLAPVLVSAAVACARPRRRPERPPGARAGHGVVGLGPPRDARDCPADAGQGPALMPAHARANNSLTRAEIPILPAGGARNPRG